MNDGIDYKKIESCMVEIYGLPDFTFDTSFYNETLKILLICNKVRYITASGIPIRSLDGTPFKENTHDGIIRKSIVATQEDCIISDEKIEIIFHEITRGKISDNFINKMKLCRINFISKKNWSVDGEGNYTFSRKTQGHRAAHGKGDNGELNVETYHSLTDSQRRIILDIIAVTEVDPLQIFIDDSSDEQLVKRQLGIGSIVQQFHR